ncbi:Fic family protein [Sodalis ligni]|uniref:Fic family protein n=1 Tax=Sodalis ligni TaxID=2697027 RepID=UPI002097A432|nr:Fic family protein [Sodalis ligni]
MAQIYQSRHNRAILPLLSVTPVNSINNVYQTFFNTFQPLTVADLSAEHPAIARRTLQRWLKQLVADGKVRARGEGRGRHYVVDLNHSAAHGLILRDDYPRYWLFSDEDRDTDPPKIPLSEDSKDILGYIERPVHVRIPVGYQRDFLDAYEPNVTFYLPEPIRNQLWRMGDMEQASKIAGTYGRGILSRLMIDLSWASSHLEGNTYSRLDTVKLIEHGQAASGKTVMETQMILNHKAAIEFLLESIKEADFNRYTLLNLHSILSENLLPKFIEGGRIRQHAVGIGKSVYRPLIGEAHISEVLDSLLIKARAITDPFEQSFFIMVHLPYLQPFGDVNKRTSRLAANLPLLRANLCPLAFLGVPEQAYCRSILGVYEVTRVELLRDLYLWAYERSVEEYRSLRQELSEPDPLRLRYRLIVKGMVYQVVAAADQDALELIEAMVAAEVKPEEQAVVKALVIEELRQLHEGSIARYRLRPAQFSAWQAKHYRTLN